jgi:hypothetical protein
VRKHTRCLVAIALFLWPSSAVLADVSVGIGGGYFHNDFDGDGFDAIDTWLLGPTVSYSHESGLGASARVLLSENSGEAIALLDGAVRYRLGSNFVASVGFRFESIDYDVTEIFFFAPTIGITGFYPVSDRITPFVSASLFPYSLQRDKRAGGHDSGFGGGGLEAGAAVDIGDRGGFALGLSGRYQVQRFFEKWRQAETVLTTLTYSF